VYQSFDSDNSYYHIPNHEETIKLLLGNFPFIFVSHNESGLGGRGIIIFYRFWIISLVVDDYGVPVLFYEASFLVDIVTKDKGKLFLSWTPWRLVALHGRHQCSN